MQASTNSILAGTIGAGALTAIHETARHTFNNSPRVELLGVRAIEKILSPLGINLSYNQLYSLSIASDLVTNGLGYAAVAALFRDNKKKLFVACGLYGATVGLATWFAPPHVGLGQQPTNNRTKTSAMTVAWYVLGGLATAAAYSLLTRNPRVTDEPGIYTETYELTITEI